MMSRSRKVSRRRRTLPASETLSTSGLRAQLLDHGEHRGQPLAEQRPHLDRARAPRRAPSGSSPRFAPRAPAAPAAAAPPRRPSARRASSARAPARVARAVFGPSPGRCMNCDDLGRHLAPCAWSAPRSRPLSTIWTIFSSIVLPIPGSSFARPSSASWAIEPAFSRTRCGGAAVGDHAERGLARQLEQVGEQLELVGDVTVPRQGLGHASDHRERAGDDLPADLQRAREPRADAARARAPAARACS